MHLTELHQLGQSPYLDQIDRELTRSGELKRMVEEEGLRGMTSNPTIFEKSISRGRIYESEIQRLASQSKSAFEIYQELAITDVREAAAVFYPVWVQSQGEDGYVSIEPPAQFAYDRERTLREVPQLFHQVGAPNIMIKLPATPEGVALLPGFIASGININVTLIFSPANYAQVARAYIQGLEERLRRGGGLTRVASVASVFVSRIDTAVDRKLEELIRSGQAPPEDAQALQGRAAVANSKIIFQKYLEAFSTSAFRVIDGLGAHRQRLLWGSTSTKNPAYSDVKYIEELIGPGTVNTIPPDTWRAFLDHGVARQTLAQGVEEARDVLRHLEALGISLEEVCSTLQREGVAAFVASLDSLLQTLEARRQAAAGTR